MPLPTPSEQRRLKSRLTLLETLLETHAGSRPGNVGAAAAPACSPDELRVTLAILWESGGFAPMPGEMIPPQRWRMVNGHREVVADGFALKRLGQWLRVQCGVSEEELGDRDWTSGVWHGEAACQRVLGLTHRDRRGGSDGQ